MHSGDGWPGGGRWRRVARAVAVAALLGWPGRAQAQQDAGSVAGVVREAGSLRPVAGAIVRIDNMDREVPTGEEGRFRIAGLPDGGTVTLRVTRIGFQPLVRTVRVGRTDLSFTLRASAVSLEDLVVTGTAVGERKRSLGNAISTIDVVETEEVAAPSNVSDLIRGRAAGVNVRTGSAMVGGGSVIRTRGVSSLSLFDEQPLVYIDGVRMDNSIGDAGPQNQVLGQQSDGGVVSRIDDIDPDQIESIEVIKGPAAATLFGTEASRGVIQILTRKGEFESGPRLELSIDQGTNSFRNATDRWPTHFFRDPVSGEVRTLNLIRNERRLGNDVFRTGHLQGYTANLSGGSDDLRYFVSADYDDEEGFESTNARQRFSGRVNLELAVDPTLDVRTSLGVIQSETELAGEFFQGIWGSLWGAEPTNEATRGWQNAPPEVFRENESFKGDLNRFTPSLTLDHRPLDWFSHRVTGGVDVVNEDNEGLIRPLAFDPALTEFSLGFGAPRFGAKFENRREVVNISLDYAGTFDLPLTEAINSRSSFGFQLYDERVEFTSAQGRDFPAPGLESVGSTAVNFSDDGFVENTTVGFYLQQQFGLNDRLFLTGAVRADDNSAFGEEFDIVVYPKVSASWVASEEPFFDVPFVDALRLRAAYGQSGQQPAAFASLRTFRPVPRADGTPAITPEAIGNSDLEPERGEEIELGFNAGLFGDRLGVDFTFFHQKTEDALLESRVPPSLGFAGFRFENIGEIQNSGIELLLEGLAVDTEPVDWSLTLNVAMNSNEVVEVGEGRDFVPSTFRGRHQEGFPAFSWFDQRIVQAELDDEGNPINVLCDGGTGKGGVEPGGAAVPCDQAPEVFLGRATPKWFGSIGSTVTLLDRIRIHSLLDFSTNFRQYNNTRQLACEFGLVCEENFFPERFDPRRIAGIREGGTFDWDIQDAGFAKLREVSLTYDLPGRIAGLVGARRASFTFAGRNLATFSGWSGLDPEGFQIGRPDRIGRQGANAPTPAQFRGTLRLGF